jgi:hypothetical protein
VTQLLALVSAPLRDLHGLVEARIKQLEEQGEIVADAATPVTEVESSDEPAAEADEPEAADEGETGEQEPEAGEEAQAEGAEETESSADEDTSSEDTSDGEEAE